ncbi:hypothetical protein HHI36_020325 [Cryptolaemus montrouzieri]|uniref:ATP synthase subunit s-like protein n=1 Tax=Cryptolaemus montrouzieri TaxID=559131 RepID=A0ABD2NB50_9CUCU
MNSSLSIILDRFTISACKNRHSAASIIRLYSERKSDLVNPNSSSTKEISKKDYEWRKSWTEETTHYFKTLRIFYTERNNVEVARWLQAPISFSPSSILNWLKNKEKQKDIIMQSYIPERNRILGNELAAAHFVVYRGGAVKFHSQDNWIKADENGEYSLPENYVRNDYLEAIDCSNMTLYYEGLQNLRNLQRVNWLSINGCENIDDWGLDHIVGSFYKTLFYLDLRNCPSITEKGLTALWKMENLKILYLDDILRTNEYEMTILMLQDHLPHLEIKVGDFAEDD